MSKYQEIISMVEEYIKKNGNFPDTLLINSNNLKKLEREILRDKKSDKRDKPDSLMTNYGALSIIVRSGKTTLARISISKQSESMTQKEFTKQMEALQERHAAETKELLEKRAFSQNPFKINDIIKNKDLRIVIKSIEVNPFLSFWPDPSCIYGGPEIDENGNILNKDKWKSIIQAIGKTEKVGEWTA